MDSQYLYGIFFLVIIILLAYLYLQHLNLAEKINLIYLKSCVADEEYDDEDEDYDEEDGEEESDVEEDESEQDIEDESELEMKVEDVLE